LTINWGWIFSLKNVSGWREIFCSFNKSKNSLLKAYKRGFVSGELFAQRMQVMLDDLIAAYSKVLSAEELKHFWMLSQTPKLLCV